MWIWILMLGLFVGACTWVIIMLIKSLDKLENERHDALMAKLGELENMWSKIEYGVSGNYKNILDTYCMVKTIKDELYSMYD